jgi:hypothetical protein
MAKRSKGAPNKSAFVRDFIEKNPQANRKAVEEAWLAAGHEGVITSALVSNLRSKLGLTAASKKAEKQWHPRVGHHHESRAEAEEAAAALQSPSERDRLGIGH